jgi:hypothetical protein
VGINYDANPGRKVHLVAGLTSLGRVAIGAASFIRPETLPRALGVDRGTARRATLLTRFFSAREAALGIGALHALRTGADVRPWLIAQAIGDAGDAAALVAATRARHVRAARGTALAVVALTGAISVTLAARALRR